ncbi:MAG TPA: tetratricopeptide repeat protein [Chitinophagales bacterium]|nr:tetratricopeptide repeat protein [Chitinophagales bacterium]
MNFHSSFEVLKTKSFLLLVFFLIASQSSFAQSNKAIDSLMNVLKTAKEDTNKVKTLNALGLKYWHKGNYAEAIKNYLDGLKLSEEIGYKVGMARAYNNIGIIYDDQGKTDEALKNYKAALKLSEELNNNRGVAACNLNIGIIYSDQGSFEEALKCHLTSLKIFEEIGEKGGTAAAYLNIGADYGHKDNYDEALKNYLAALNIAKEMGDTGLIAFAMENAGEVYTSLKNYPLAKEYLINALTLAKQMGGIELLRNTYKGMARMDSVTGNFQSAFGNYKLYTAYKDSMINESNNKDIAQMKEEYESEKKDKEIVQLESDKQNLENEKQISALMLKTKQDSLSVVQAENDKAQLENERMQTLNLYNQQQMTLLGNEKQIQQLQLEKDKSDYAVQKAEAEKNQEQLAVVEKEKSIQTLELNKQRQAKNFFITGLALFAVLSFFIYRSYRTRQELKLQTLRNKIASDLHDDVGSTLSSISIFSQMAQAQSKEVIPALQTIGESSRKMLDAMADIVWTINPANDQFEKIIMRMRSFAYELLGAKQIDFEFDADDDVTKTKLPMEVRKNLYLIFKEATNNMVKYSEATKAMFTIKNEKDRFSMMIRDNGKGFDATKESSGNGLKNMKKRALEIGALLLIDSMPGNGTTIKLELAA